MRSLCVFVFSDVFSKAIQVQIIKLSATFIKFRLNQRCVGSFCLMKLYCFSEASSCIRKKKKRLFSKDAPSDRESCKVSKIRTPNNWITASDKPVIIAESSLYLKRMASDSCTFLFSFFFFTHSNVNATALIG